MKVILTQTSDCDLEKEIYVDDAITLKDLRDILAIEFNNDGSIPYVVYERLDDEDFAVVVEFYDDYRE